MGGFIVEFSYCIPGYQDCVNRTQTSHNGFSDYIFYRSNFTGNSASAMVANRLVPYNESHAGFGRGGGMAIFFKSNAASNNIQILLCQFLRNRAVWGGGLFVFFGDTATGNSVNVAKALFYENNCHQNGIGGGGLRILSVLDFRYDFPKVESNRVDVNGYFIANSAKSGGGLSFSPTYQNQKLLKEQTTLVVISNSVFSENFAPIGAAIHLQIYPTYAEGTINSVSVENCTFQHNTIRNYPEEPSHDAGIGTIYAFEVNINFLYHVLFSNNYGSALAILHSHVTFYNTNASFVGNSGDTGGAMAFMGGSHALVNENTEMYFKNNFARKGGAIYNHVSIQGITTSNMHCIVQYADPFLDRRNWKASFTFDNNTSTGMTSNSLFSTSVFPCALGNTEEDTPLTEMLLFCINPHWKFVNSNCTREIQTQGRFYKFRNASTITSFPGQGFDLPIYVFDDLNHNITNSVGYTSAVSENDSMIAQVDPKFTLTSGNYLILTGKENSSVNLELQSSESRPHQLTMDVKLLPCPPGFHFDVPGVNHANKSYLGTCTCTAMYSFQNKLNCSTSSFRAQIPWNFWIGMDPTGQREGKLVMSELPNVYSEQNFENIYYFTLPESYDKLDEKICGVRNRTGTICGKCKENHSTSINSYDYSCTPCGDGTDFAKNIFIFFLFAYVPYFIILVAIAYFKLKFTSSATNGFILFAQLICIDIFNINGSSRISFDTIGLNKAYLFVYGLFNFNSFANVMRPFCIHRNFTALDVLCLEYTLAGLPLVIILLTYLLVRLRNIKFLCCKKRQISVQASVFHTRLRQGGQRNKKNKEGSLVHALVAFILLSYTKFSLVSMKVLTTQKLFDEEGNYLNGERIYFAGHLAFSSREYLLPYGLIAISVMVLVIIPPLFLLGIPQLVDQLLDKERFSCFRKVWPSVTLHIFLDAFQGFYKPNRRFFAGIYFIFRLVVTFSYIFTRSYLDTYILQEIYIIVMIALLAILKPYKKEIFNTVDILIFLNLGIINLISTYTYASSLSISSLGLKSARQLYLIQYCLLWLPLIYMLSYVTFKLLVKIGLYQYIADKVRSHYSVLREEDPLYSDVSNTGEDSFNEGRLSDLDSLSDAALFIRAEGMNRFRSPLRVQQKKVHSTLVNVLGGEEDKSTGSTVEFDTESTEKGTNSS